MLLKFYSFFFYLLNVVSSKFKMTYVAHIIFLLHSTSPNNIPTLRILSNYFQIPKVSASGYIYYHPHQCQLSCNAKLLVSHWAITYSPHCKLGLLFVRLLVRVQGPVCGLGTEFPGELCLWRNCTNDPGLVIIYFNQLK